MGITTFEILLDSPTKQFTPGETVAGNVHIKKNGDYRTAGIVIRFFGMVETNWLQHSTQSRRSTRTDGTHETKYRTIRKPYHGQELILEQISLLFSDGHTPQSLPSDDLRLPFKFEIPDKPMPITCSVANEGFVSYGIEAMINNAPNPEIKCGVPITMLAIPLDLNTIPGADLPINGNNQQIVGGFCCCGGGKPVQIIVKTPRRGIVMGETVPVEIQVFNQSDKRVADVSCELSQVWTLFGQQVGWGQMTLPRVHPITVAGARRGQPIPPGAQGECSFQLQVPKVLPPTIPESACALIKMGYAINAQALVQQGGFLGLPGCVMVSLPVVVGNTPHENAILNIHTPSNTGAGGAF